MSSSYRHFIGMKDFEKSRIELLQEERELVQKKIFTKWCNSFLSKYEMEITNLFKDLDDGKRLIKLLEVISGKKLGKPDQGRMKVHKIHNINMAISFIQTQLQEIGAKLENISAEDILDGNRTLILGLIWTIILRFQISAISEIHDDARMEIYEKSIQSSSKEILMLWCQNQVVGYPGVRIVDFTNSWRDGKAFNALVHSKRPDLFDYSEIYASNNNKKNLNHAFDVAEKKMGISRILDAEDIDIDNPDEKLVLTYVSTIYHAFVKIRKDSFESKPNVQNDNEQGKESQTSRENKEDTNKNLSNRISNINFETNLTLDMDSFKRDYDYDRPTLLLSII